MIDKPGKYEISFEEYLQDPCPEPSLTRGAIIDLLDSPARAWWNHPRLNPQPPEPENEMKFDIGTAAHSLLLEGGEAICIIEGFDDWRKKEAQALREAAREGGKVPLLAKQAEKVYDMVHAAVTAIRGCEELDIVDLRSAGTAEQTYIWKESGIWCRIRPDWIRDDGAIILDYKTSGTSVNPSIYSNHIGRMGYGIQSAFYRRGVKTVEGLKGDMGYDPPTFIFLAQETDPPYFCSFHALDFQSEDMAVQKVEWAIKKWGECLKSDKWEGYPNRICYAEPKPWEMAEWEMRRAS